MTKEELHAEIGRAFVERRELTQKISVLRNRIRSSGQAYAALADNPVHIDSLAAVQEAPNLGNDFIELQQCLVHLERLDETLS